MAATSEFIFDDPRIHENLKGLTKVRVETIVDFDDPTATYVPVTSSALRDNVLKHLLSVGIEEDSSPQNPVLYVCAGLRFKTDPNLQLTYWFSRTEVVLRELASFRRFESSSRQCVDTWRHRANVGIHCGVIKPQDVGSQIETDLTRQIERFTGDWRRANGRDPNEDPGKSDRVKKAQDLLTHGTVYAKGCSGFVCDVLGIGWEDANDLLGETPVLVGDNNVYVGLAPGDIVGWKSETGSGHVAVYIGKVGGPKFIDVHKPNEKPRAVNDGYGFGRKVFRSSRF